MRHERPTTILLREDDRNPGHVRVTVWIGRNPGARGNSGTLTIRTDEWDELRDRLDDGNLDEVVEIELLAERSTL